MSVGEFYGLLALIGLGTLAVLVLGMGLYFWRDDRRHAKHIAMRFDLALLEMDSLYGKDKDGNR